MLEFALVMAASVSLDQTVIPVLVALLSSGFIFGLFKIMPERRSILVQASENAVKVVNEAIGTLQKELIDARTEIARLESELVTARNAAVETRLQSELKLAALQAQVTRLETQLEIYREMKIGTVGPQGNQGNQGERGPQGLPGSVDDITGPNSA